MEGFFSETDIYTHTDRVLYRLCSAGHCKQFRTASVSDFSEYICRITLLITINFIIQLMTDFLSAGFVDRIGYRASMLIAHAASAAGLICLPLLPELLPDPFAGLLIAVGIYAVGGGLLEVLVSPVVEALPTKNKEKNDEYAPFVLLLGTCSGRASLDCVLRSVRYGELADHGSLMGARSNL